MSRDERNPWEGVAFFFFLAPKGRRRLEKERPSAPSGAGRARRPFFTGSVRRRRNPPVATTLGPLGAGWKPGSVVRGGSHTSSSARPVGLADREAGHSPHRTVQVEDNPVAGRVLGHVNRQSASPTPSLIFWNRTSGWPFCPTSRPRQNVV